MDQKTIEVINKYYRMADSKLEEKPTMGNFRFVKIGLEKMRRDRHDDINILKEYIKQRQSRQLNSYDNNLLTISLALIPEIIKFIPKPCDESDEYYLEGKGGRKSRRRSKKSRKSRKSRR